jgi:hypothetical protein
MARDYIKIDRDGTPPAIKAALLLQYIEQLRAAYDTGQRVLQIMNHNNDGSNWTDLEQLFGIPTGKGQTIYNLINGSIGSMTGVFQVADAKNLTETVGG